MLLMHQNTRILQSARTTLTLQWRSSVGAITSQGRDNRLVCLPSSQLLCLASTYSLCFLAPQPSFKTAQICCTAIIAAATMQPRRQISHIHSLWRCLETPVGRRANELRSLLCTKSLPIQAIHDAPTIVWTTPANTVDRLAQWLQLENWWLINHADTSPCNSNAVMSNTTSQQQFHIRT